MMNCLIIYSHPNPKSFNRAIVRTLVTSLRREKHCVRVRDLYQMKFNPVLGPQDFRLLARQQVCADVRQEQAHVAWADTIIFVFPVWWNSLPAIARGYMDRVFSVNFAYTEKGQGLLQGKKVVTIATMNAPQKVCQQQGIFQALETTISACLANFCGMTLAAQKYFNSVALVSAAERRRMLKDVSLLARTLQ